MQPSRLIIGIMGGGEQRKVAQRLGAAIISRGHIMLTGGKNQDTAEAKDAALFGAVQAAKSSGGVARFVGIISKGDAGSPVSWCPYLIPHERSFILQTGLSSAGRDCITGVTPDALIILRGSKGTLTECAFAKLTGRPILHLASKAWLSQKRREHGNTPGDSELIEFFEEANSVYSKLTDFQFTVPDLSFGLDQSLDEDPEFPEGSEEAAVDEAIERSLPRPAGTPTFFPGLPIDKKSTKEAFEEVVKKIAK